MALFFCTWSCNPVDRHASETESRLYKTMFSRLWWSSFANLPQGDKLTVPCNILALLDLAMAPIFTSAILSTLLVSAAAQSLNVVNQCGEEVFLFTQTSFGTIANNLQVPAGATQNMGISSNWDGAVNVGKCCLPNMSSCHLCLVLTVCRYWLWQ